MIRFIKYNSKYNNYSNRVFLFVYPSPLSYLLSAFFVSRIFIVCVSSVLNT